MTRSDVVKFLEIAQRERVTHAMLVPVQYQRILASGLRQVRPQRLQDQALDQCAVACPHQGRLLALAGPANGIYGLTEGGGSCILEANLHPDKLHTVGPPALGSEIVVLMSKARSCGKVRSASSPAAPRR